MPYPYQIDPAGDLNNGARGADYPPIRLGPFEYTNPLTAAKTLYCVLHADFENDHEVWKSTDAGVNWTEADSANAPANHASHITFNVHRDGNTLYVSYVDAAQTLSVKRFDMSTGTWGTAITGGPTPTVDPSDPNLPVTKWAIIPRSDGTYVAIYQSKQNVGGTNYGRVYYAIYSASTWGAPIQADTETTGLAKRSGFVGAVLGADDRIHMFWFDDLWYMLRHRSLSSADALDNLQIVFAHQKSTTIPIWSAPMTYADACGNTYVAIAAAHWNLTDVPFPYTSAPTLRPMHMYFRSGANPRLSADISQDTSYGPSDYPFTGDGASMSLLYDSNTLYAFWASKGEQTGATFKLMHSANKGAGWGTPVELLDTSTNPIHQIYAEKIDAGVGVVLSSQDPNADTYSQPHYWQGSLSATAPEPCNGGATATYARGGSFG